SGTSITSANPSGSPVPAARIRPCTRARAEAGTGVHASAARAISASITTAAPRGRGVRMKQEFTKRDIGHDLRSREGARIPRWWLDSAGSGPAAAIAIAVAGPFQRSGAAGVSVDAHELAT